MHGSRLSVAVMGALLAMCKDTTEDAELRWREALIAAARKSREDNA